MGGKNLDPCTEYHSIGWDKRPPAKFIVTYVGGASFLKRVCGVHVRRYQSSIERSNGKSAYRIEAI